MKAFHGDPAIKEKYLSRVRAHAVAGDISQGLGWRDGKGCDIGGTFKDFGDWRYQVELGFPKWLAHLEHSIFEGLPKNDALKWPEALLQAIPVGIDVDLVVHKLAVVRMDRLIDIQRINLIRFGNDLGDVIRKTLEALTAVRLCHESALGGIACDWSMARSMAWKAARSAWPAAFSASASAESASVSAARSAEWPAEWSASLSAGARLEWSKPGAATAAWRQEAADLLTLVKEAA